jgi:hypothetical protein
MPTPSAHPLQEKWVAQLGAGGACVPRDPSRSSGGSGTCSAVTHRLGPCADPARRSPGAAAAPGPGSSLLGG